MFHDSLSDHELRVWEAVFAAEYVRDRRALEEACRERGGQRLLAHVTAFDQAAESMSAERAATVADEAVQKLRDWAG